MSDLTNCFQKERWEKRHGTAKVTGPSATISTTSRARPAGPGPSHSREASRPPLKERSVQSWLASLPSPNDDDETTSARRAKPPKPVSGHSHDHQEHQEDLSASQHPPSHSSVKHPLERHTRHSECNCCTKSDHHAHCAVEPRCHSTYATHSHSHHGHDPCHLAPVTRCVVRTSCQDQDSYGSGCSCQGTHARHSICSHAQVSHTPHHAPYVSAHHTHNAAEASAVQHGGSPQQNYVTPSVHSRRAKKPDHASGNAAKQTKPENIPAAHAVLPNNMQSTSQNNHKGKAFVKKERPEAGIQYSFVFNNVNVHETTRVHGSTHNVDVCKVQNNLVDIHLDKASKGLYKPDDKKTGAAQVPSSMSSKHSGTAGTGQITHEAKEFKKVVGIVPLRKGWMHTPPKKPAPGNLLEYPGRHDDFFSGRRPGGKGDKTALVPVR